MVNELFCDRKDLCKDGKEFCINNQILLMIYFIELQYYLCFSWQQTLPVSIKSIQGVHTFITTKNQDNIKNIKKNFQEISRLSVEIIL